MLRSFRLGNHRSFLDEQELLLMPASPGDERPVVPVTAIYGANASGKSNLVSALRFMRDAVRFSFSDWEADEGVPRRPCRLSGVDRESPSAFVIDLVADGVRHTYGFTIDDHRVREEWLYAYPEKRKRVVFEREGDDLRFGSTVAERKATLVVVDELIRPNSLFLSMGAKLALAPLMPVYRWFTGQLNIRSLETRDRAQRVADYVGTYVGQDPRNHDRVVALLKAADVGISGLQIEETGAPPSGVRGVKGDQRWWELKLIHGDGAQFDLTDESAGTRNWLNLLPVVLKVLDAGQVLLVDEIDSSLHPLLTAQLAGLFQEKRTNPRMAQLIFTTHDTSLLGTMLGDQVLGRDEIWFAEKRQNGSTELVALTDFKPRKEHNLERRYLGGSFGGVPVLDRQDFVDAVLL
ncbi:ATP/GTP-binding protein [Amycolatopsis sp. NPDC059021]|uniref:AAA family ATPase n=1 Tax=Amycolatopsis sp. NPDC059021 TaxID=3346704 RepID=UPI00366B05A7